MTAAGRAAAVLRWLRRLIRRPTAHPPARPVEPDPIPAPEPAPEPVPQEALQELAERFRAGGPVAQANGVGRGEAKPYLKAASAPLTQKLRRRLIESEESGLMVAVDGSVRLKSGVVAFAAVCTNGRALAGWLPDPAREMMTSFYAEIQGARLGLRLIPQGRPARLTLDNEYAHAVLAKMDHHSDARIGRINDKALFGELRGLNQTRHVKIMLVNNQTRASQEKLTHTNMLMALAHNVAFATGYLLEHGAGNMAEHRPFLESLIDPTITRERHLVREKCRHYVGEHMLAGIPEKGGV